MNPPQTNKAHSFKRSEVRHSLEDHNVILTKLNGDGWVLNKAKANK